MTRSELATLQQEQTVAVLSALFNRCREQYLNAAQLVGLHSPVVEQLRALGRQDRLDLSPLLPAWEVLCKVYQAHSYEPQASLFESHDEQCERMWHKFVYERFMPAMLEEHEVVRNVLRAVGGLPSSSATDAAEAFRIYVQDRFIFEETN